VVSRSVRDTAAALDATAGPEIGDPYAAPPAPGSYLAATKRKPKKLRIAFATKRLGGEAFDPECKAATEAAAKLCAKLGHHIEESLPQVSPDDIGANFLPMGFGPHDKRRSQRQNNGQDADARRIRGLDLEPLSIRQDHHRRTIPTLLGELAARLAPSCGMAATLRRLDHAGARNAADEARHGQL